METETVRVRLPQAPPPSPGHGRRLALIAALFLVVGLVMYGALSLAEKRGGPSSGASPLTAGPGETLELLDGPIAADGKALDPVTHEEVDPATAPFQADVYGTTFYFASRDSFQRFREDPFKYVKVKVKVQLHPDAPAVATPETLPAEAEPVEEPAAAAPPEPADTPAPGGEQWSEPTEPPPPLEAPAGGSDPGWLPEDPTSGPAAEPPAAEPPPPQPAQPKAGPGDDVILGPATPAAPAPVPDEGDVILPPAGPAGPPTPLRQ